MRAIKPLFMLLLLSASALLSADCMQTCQEKYDDCMLGAHSGGQQGICREILHKCQTDCSG